MFEPLDAFAKVAAAPLSFVWKEGHTPWITDGSRTPIVRKLGAMSIRAGLALNAVSLEWLMHRLVSAKTTPAKPSKAAVKSGSAAKSAKGTKSEKSTKDGSASKVGGAQLPASWERARAMIWAEILQPRTVELDRLVVEPVGREKVDGPLTEFLRGTKSIVRIARDFDGAFHSYLESNLRLVDYVMPSPAYKTWRGKTYDGLASVSGSFAMSTVYENVIVAKAKTLGVPDYEAEEQIVAEEGMGALWGPVVLREELIAGAALDDQERRAALTRLEQTVTDSVG